MAIELSEGARQLARDMVTAAPGAVHPPSLTALNARELGLFVLNQLGEKPCLNNLPK